MENKDKIHRVLFIYNELHQGQVINKLQQATRFGVNERSIQRDIDDIRAFLELNVDNGGITNTVIYDRARKGYRLEKSQSNHLANSEILALCKILLDSRAFTKKEMDNMIEKVVAGCVPESNKQVVTDLIRNEAFHYIEPRHKSVFIDKMWEIGQAIRQSKYIEIEYYRVMKDDYVTRKIKPVAVMFSEYYFYLAAFIEDKEVQDNFDIINDAFPTIYRIDRIQSVKVFDEHYHIPYKDRFQEGEFRKRIQFMYGGKLQRIKFKYKGYDIDAVMDRLPTAQIIYEDEGTYIIAAEVFGKGIDMWLRSQGDLIELIVEK